MMKLLSCYLLLTIDLEGLSKGLEMLEDSISTVLKEVNH